MPHQNPEQTLNNLLKHSQLSNGQAQEGISACFIITNRKFITRRMGDQPLEKIDQTTRDLIQQVFVELGMGNRQPTIGELHNAFHTLEAQFGFTSEPDLLKQHQKVIQMLLERLGS